MTALPSISYFEEPLLQFRYGQKLAYPRDGLFLYGPVDEGSDVQQVRYGVISTPQGLEHFKAWSGSISKFINVPPRGPRSREIEPQHVPFPGFSEAFGATWPVDPPVAITDIDPAALSNALRISNRHEAIRTAVDLFVEPLVKAHDRLEHPPTFWFVVIPEEVYQLGRPQSQVAKKDRLPGKITISKAKSQKLEKEPTFFDEEEQTDVYKYATHFRRQLKARLLKHRIVTQLARETTLNPNAFLNASGRPLRRLEDPATVAWKLGTGCYYKAGGRPWQLANVRPGVCYVGLVYKQDDTAEDRRYAVCAAQMFLSNGEGVVFRGALGPWFQTDIKQFHLSRDAAANLISMVVSEYKRLHNGNPPQELFIHAKSAFSDEEWNGFCDGCPTTVNLVGVQITDPRDGLKLFRPGEYPVMRGTALKLDDRQAYLWTAGYVPRLDTYMGPETPNPVFVRVLRGNCDLDQVLIDVLGLTKINFNSCLLNDRMPVTIRFANAVGDVLMSAPMDGEPKLPFKFYI